MEYSDNGEGFRFSGTGEVEPGAYLIMVGNEEVYIKYVEVLGGALEDFVSPGDVVLGWKKLPLNMYVSRFRVDRAYGGPEEGGWWYDVMTVDSYEVFPPDRYGEGLASYQRWKKEDDLMWKEAKVLPDSVIYPGNLLVTLILFHLPVDHPVVKPRYN
jgi:hypothetical protein